MDFPAFLSLIILRMIATTIKTTIAPTKSVPICHTSFLSNCAHDVIVYTEKQIGAPENVHRFQFLYFAVTFTFSVNVVLSL